jgi:hypothetical protein
MQTEDIDKKRKETERYNVKREKYDFHKKAHEYKKNGKSKRCLNKIARIRRQYKPFVPKGSNEKSKKGKNKYTKEMLHISIVTYYYVIAIRPEWIKNSRI